MSSRRDVARQREFHLRMFDSLYAWDRASEVIVDLTGDDSVAGMVGLDQMGHFGPNACDMVAAAVHEAFAADRALRLAELGAGFGGAIRAVRAAFARQGRVVELACAFELVPDHCALMRTIDDSLGVKGTGPVCADVAALPVGAAVLDAVFATGSVPHFADMASVLGEAARVLRPGGLLVITEEVSLRGPAALTPEFLERHPPGVFFFASPADRRDQLHRGGFVDVVGEDLTDWAMALLRDRLKALDLFYGTAENLFGVRQTERIVRQLEVTRKEYERGALIPMSFTARKPGGD